MVRAQYTEGFAGSPMKRHASKNILFWVYLVLPGCTVIDVTQDSELTYLVDKGYEIQQGGFIYRQRCGNIDGTFHGWGECNVIQVAGECFPKSFDEYKSHPGLSTELLRKCLPYPDGKNAEILGYVPSGTIVTIDKIVKYPQGTVVICWAIRGRIKSGEFSEYEVQFPTCPYHEPPSWFYPNAVHIPGLPQPKPEFLKSIE
jgi:hypothetical protein